MADPKRPSERRRTPRVAANLPVKLTCGKKKVSTEAQEFSEFGIFLACHDKELLGQNVELAIRFDVTKSTVTVEGVVAYANDGGLGVRFKNVAKDQELALQQQLNALILAAKAPAKQA